MSRPARVLLILLLGSGTPAHALAPAGDSALLAGLRVYLGTFQPVPGETSLLAYARRETLDWTAFQNLFPVQATDLGAGALDWRGHTATATGSVFTTLRAATYAAGTRTLLVVNREWCAAATCQTRTAFGWFGGGHLTPVNDGAVIPLIRDADFYPGAVPPCLKGVSLNVTYVPTRAGTGLAAVAVAPPAAHEACARAGLAPESATRPLTLAWSAGAGKFRRNW